MPTFGSPIPASEPRRIPASAFLLVLAQLFVVGFALSICETGFLIAVAFGSFAISWLIAIVHAVVRHQRLTHRPVLWYWLGSLVALFGIGAALGFANPSTYARQANMGSIERQVVVACLAYCDDDNTRWPTDLATLSTWSHGEINDHLLRLPWNPGIQHPFLYTRPVPFGKMPLPVLVSDPACDARGAIVVCFTDAHIRIIRNRTEAAAVWAEATRLAASPQAKEIGIRPTDWTTSPNG